MIIFLSDWFRCVPSIPIPWARNTPWFSAQLIVSARIRWQQLVHQRLNLVEDIWAVEDDKSEQCRKLDTKPHVKITLSKDNTVCFRLISEQHINVWAKHMIQCASWLWMATFVASILLAALSHAYTMLLYWLHDHKYHCIWSNNIIYIYTLDVSTCILYDHIIYLNVMNAHAASFHPCILVDTLMIALHYHFVQQDSGSWWLGVCHWTVIFIATCCHWKPDSIELSWYRHLRT